MRYEHLRTDELDFDIDRDVLEEDGWEIIAVSQGMIYWKREVIEDAADGFAEGGPITPTGPDEWIWKEVPPPYTHPVPSWPTIQPYPTYPTYPTWIDNPNEWEPKRGDIFVTYNFAGNSDGVIEEIKAALDR